MTYCKICNSQLVDDKFYDDLLKCPTCLSPPNTWFYKKNNKTTDVPFAGYYLTRYNKMGNSIDVSESYYIIHKNKAWHIFHVLTEPYSMLYEFGTNRHKQIPSDDYETILRILDLDVFC